LTHIKTQTHTEKCKYNNRKRDRQADMSDRQTDRYRGAHRDRDREVHLGRTRSTHGQTRRNKSEVHTERHKDI